MSNVFLPLVVPSSASPAPFSLTKEAVLLASFQSVTSHTFPDPVTSIKFSPLQPHDLAVASGFAVTLVSPFGGKIRKSFTRFRGTVYSPHYKQDGKLLVAGSGDGVAKVFDVNSRTELRVLNGHSGALRTAKFTQDGLHIVTGSDDTTVRVWDLATSTSLYTLHDSKDYVLCQSSSPMSQHVWAVGSADRKVRVYDLRSRKIIFMLDQEHPVDDVHILPGGLRAISVGGQDVKMWDFLSGGSVSHRMACHAKATTCAAIDPVHSRLATAGLDGNVKIYDLDTMETRGLLSFGSQILSLDISPNGRKFAVGMVDGGVDIRAARSKISNASDQNVKIPPRPREFEGWGRGFEKVDAPVGPKLGTKRYFNRGMSVEPKESDAVVDLSRIPKLKPYDYCLRKFEHSEALDNAISTHDPYVVIAVIDELVRRGVLSNVISNRELVDIIPLLKLIRKHLRNPLVSKKLLMILDIILDLYGSDFNGTNQEFDSNVRGIMRIVGHEVKAQRELCNILGMSDMISSVRRLAKDS